jgi:regulatory protein
MERSERLAPVTYLPGVQPAPGRSRPSFAAMYDETAMYDESESASDFVQPAADVSPHPVPDADLYAAPDRDAELARAEKVSLHALTRRGQSRRELERTLRARDLSDDVIAHEIERLERVGLVDDIALAQNLVGVQQERKGLGRTGIAGELTRRLLSPAAIEYALELVDSGDELARARELAVKRAGQLASYDRETAQRRLSGYLARRGYSGSTVRAAVDHALASRTSASGVRFR